MSLVEELHKLIEQVMVDAGRGPAGPIVGSTRLRNDLGFDSLELAVLTVHIEAKFGVDVFADGVVETVGELEKKVRSLKGEV